MSGVLEKHDRTRFHITVFSMGPDSSGGTRKRVAAACEEFIDVRDLSDSDLVILARHLEIDIAVDLQGFTNANRAGAFARRLAPVQINYLGYPGTMGASYMDYILADQFLIPESERAHYSEAIAYLPDCFQANDNTKRIPPAPTRAAMGLPERGLIFCSFHSNYKLNPPLFDVWMRLLAAVPDSVLWLLGSNPWVQENVRREALSRGIASDQIVFAGSLPYPEHLARLQLADICLDTLPFNGGTTTSDALWAGVPVVTCSGASFAARMSGSLLHAIGLPQLVTHSLGEYEQLALRLAKDPLLLAETRATLAQNRRAAPLFDTDRFRRHLEAAYQIMVERSRNGLAPATFRVPSVAERAHDI
jgi:predicted O-linked N-acetylglucosamine transferase (SPINDLY family)